MSQVLVDQLRVLGQRLGKAVAAGRQDGTRRFWLVAQQLRSHLPPLVLPGRTGSSQPRVGFLLAESSADFIDSGDRSADDGFDSYLYLHGPYASPRSFAVKKQVDLNSLTEVQAARAIAEDDLDALIDVDGTALARLPIVLALHPSRCLIEPLFDPPVWGVKPAHVARGELQAIGRAAVMALARSVLNSVKTDAAYVTTVAVLNERLNRGIQLHQRGDLQAADAYYTEVLAAHPRHPIAAYLSSEIQHQLGRNEASIALLKMATDAAPEFRDAHYTLARRLFELSRWQESVVAYRRTLDLTPGFAAAWSGLGLATMQLGRASDRVAVSHLERAVALEPNVAQWSFNLGATHQRGGARVAAREAYRRALSVEPGHVDAKFNLAAIAQDDGDFEAASTGYREVIAERPDLSDAYVQLGACLQQSGLIEQWIANFERFRERCPESLATAVYGLEASMAMGDPAAHIRWRDRILNGEFPARDANEHTANWEQLLFLLLHVDVNRATLKEWYLRYDEAAKACYGLPGAITGARHGGPLRIGYLSGDLRDHVMGKMIHQLVVNHDRRRFTPILYSLTATADAWTDRFRSLGFSFVDLSGRPASDAASRIAQDDVDLLVDCCGHTRGAQQGILALKPARVMATHVPTPGPVGLSAIDYKLTDALAESEDAQQFLIERLWPIENGVFPWHRYPEAAPASRPDAGIPADAFVCGAFVSLMKLSPRCLALWRRILALVPNAMLAFSPAGADWRPSYLRWLAAHGIDAERIVFIPHSTDEAASLARYRLLDIALDPLPCGNVNGTMEALAMGVPIVTLAGVRHGERLGNALLRRFGIDEGIAATETEYVELVHRLATDRAWLARVRSRITAAGKTSIVWDAEARVRDFEAAIVAMADRPMVVPSEP